MELPDLDVRAARFVDGPGEQLLDVAEAFFAQQLEVAAGHEAALAGHRLDEALRFQLGVGALRRDDADAQIAGQRPDGGQLLPLVQLTREDEGFHLRDDLVVDGPVARIRDDDVQLRLPFVFRARRARGGGAVKSGSASRIARWRVAASRFAPGGSKHVPRPLQPGSVYIPDMHTINNSHGSVKKES